MSPATAAITAEPESNVIHVRPPSHALPFVSAPTGGRANFWAPQRTGSYEQDCALGRGYAEALLAHLTEHNDQIIFGSIVRAITQQGVYEGVEIGFCSRLGFALCGFIGGR